MIEIINKPIDEMPDDVEEN